MAGVLANIIVSWKRIHQNLSLSFLDYSIILPPRDSKAKTRSNGNEKEKKL